MKKEVVLLVLGVVLLGVSVQRAEAQNANIVQEIIGTWVDQYGETWVFNADGYLTHIYRNGNKDEYKYAVTDTKLAFKRYNLPIVTFRIFDISLSSDGKALILTHLYEGSTLGYWLEKNK
jgi:hypothetical protein